MTTADPDFLSGTIWTLRKGEDIAIAQLWTIKGAGLEVRYLCNGEIREARQFHGPRAGTEAVDTAVARREELEREGWSR